MTDDNICYCGNYGGGKHTRSARCPGGERGAQAPTTDILTPGLDKPLGSRTSNQCDVMGGCPELREARSALERLRTGRQNSQRINDNGAREIERLRAALLEAVKLIDEDVPREVKTRLCRIAGHDCEFTRLPSETGGELEQLRRIDRAARYFVDFLDTCAPQGGVWTDYIPTDALDALQPLELALFDGRPAMKASEGAT